MIKVPSVYPAALLAAMLLILGMLVADFGAGMIAGLLMLAIYYLACILSAIEQLYHKMDSRFFDVLAYINPITEAVERAEQQEKQAEQDKQREAL